MNEVFDIFHEKMGTGFDIRTVPEQSIAKYRGKLPDLLLSYWQEYGWGGYADGLFWLVNPEEYEPVLDAWIGETPYMERDAYHIIARSAFGLLYLFGEQTGRSLTISPYGSYCLVDETLKKQTKEELELDIDIFLTRQDRERNDFEDLFAPALKQLGRLKFDEMYGFVPALALGGQPEVKNLQKLNAIVHLSILAELGSLTEINSSNVFSL